MRSDPPRRAAPPAERRPAPELGIRTTLEIEPAKLYVMINPEITEASSERFSMAEGCLSLPGWYGAIERTYEGESSQGSICMAVPQFAATG